MEVDLHSEFKKNSLHSWWFGAGSARTVKERNFLKFSIGGKNWREPAEKERDMHCTEEPEEWLFEARILRRTEKNLPTQDHCSWQESQFFFPVVPPSSIVIFSAFFLAAFSSSFEVGCCTEPELRARLSAYRFSIWRFLIVSICS